MEKKPFIREIWLGNFLSFSAETAKERGFIKLHPLNVLIGANGSGKSNFLEAFNLLRALPKDVSAVFRSGGGANAYLWKGGSGAKIAGIGVTVDFPGREQPLSYEFHFSAVDRAAQIEGEEIRTDSEDGYISPFYRYERDSSIQNAWVRRAHGNPAPDGEQELTSYPLEKPNQSILAQLRDATAYPEITYLAHELPKIRLYREWHTDTQSVLRKPQPTDLLPDFLSDDGNNLGLVLSNLPLHARKEVETYLQKCYEDTNGIHLPIYGNTVLLHVEEKFLTEPTPASRLSDGMLRWLCLLSILCHPAPPPLICVEEPEIGLHPDMLHVLADLLIEASQRTQLIVTTHSDLLVSSLGNMAPESVIVCERGIDGTRMKRPDPTHLQKWLKDSSLGDLWLQGQIGGTRW